MFNRDGLSSFFRFYILKNFKSFRIEVRRIEFSRRCLQFFLKLANNWYRELEERFIVFIPRDLNLLFTLLRECSKNQI